MDALQKSLWRVPVICAVGGVFTTFALIQWLGRWALETLPDGSITVNLTRELILYGVLFCLVLGVGGWFGLRGIRQRDVLLSAAIVSAYGLALLGLQYVTGATSGAGAVWIYYLNIPLSWCDFWGALCQRLFGDGSVRSVWLCSIPGRFAPLLFTLFGGRAK